MHTQRAIYICTPTYESVGKQTLDNRPCGRKGPRVHFLSDAPIYYFHIFREIDRKTQLSSSCWPSEHCTIMSPSGHRGGVQCGCPVRERGDAAKNGIGKETDPEERREIPSEDVLGPQSYLATVVFPGD